MYHDYIEDSARRRVARAAERALVGIIAMLSVLFAVILACGAYLSSLA